MTLIGLASTGGYPYAHEDTRIVDVREYSAGEVKQSSLMEEYVPIQVDYDRHRLHNRNPAATGAGFPRSTSLDDDIGKTNADAIKAQESIDGQVESIEAGVGVIVFTKGDGEFFERKVPLTLLSSVNADIPGARVRVRVVQQGNTVESELLNISAHSQPAWIKSVVDPNSVFKKLNKKLNTPLG